MKAIEADPNTRYQTAKDLSDALEKAAGGAGGGLMSKIKGKLF